MNIAYKTPDLPVVVQLGNKEITKMIRVAYEGEGKGVMTSDQDSPDFVSL